MALPQLSAIWLPGMRAMPKVSPGQTEELP
jgi:hypothetical protein